MKATHTSITLFLIFLSASVHSQETGFGLPPILEQSSACLSEQERDHIKRILTEKSIHKAARSTNTVKFEWPVRQSANYDEKEVIGISNYVDWNESYPNNLTDYNCGARSYDTESGYNHKGTDIFSWPFTWHKMDNDHVEIVAAADGTIIYKEGSRDDKSCSFNNSSWNAIYIQHTDGSIAWYGHLKRGSLTNKDENDFVKAGEFLGVMGSSGNSTGPHLHLEIYDSNGKLIDPFAGNCNSSTSESWWIDQPDYFNSGISNVLTHDSPPAFGCYGSESPNLRVDFNHGERAYFATYFRDQMQNGVSNHAVYRPDGTLFQEWTTLSPQFYAGSYWYRSFDLPSAGGEGKWSFVSSYEGDELTRHFYLTSNADDVVGFSETSLVLNEYKIGDVIEGSFDILNTGDNGVIVTGIDYPGDFSGNWDGIIDAGDSKTIHFTFNPTSIEPLDDVITVKTSRGTFDLSVVAEAPILGLDEESQVQFYPNPVHDGILKFTEVVDNAEIITMSGKVLMTINSKVNELDISHLRKGIYIINATFNEVKTSKRLVIGD